MVIENIIFSIFKNKKHKIIFFIIKFIFYFLFLENKNLFRK